MPSHYILQYLFFSLHVFSKYYNFSGIRTNGKGQNLRRNLNTTEAGSSLRDVWQGRDIMAAYSDKLRLTTTAEDGPMIVAQTCQRDGQERSLGKLAIEQL